MGPAGLQSAPLPGQALPGRCQPARVVPVGDQPSTVQLGPTGPGQYTLAASHKAAAHVCLTRTEPHPTSAARRWHALDKFLLPRLHVMKRDLDRASCRATCGVQHALGRPCAP